MERVWGWWIPSERCSGRTAAGAQISSMESAGTNPLFFPLLTFRNISPSSNFPTQIWGEQRALKLLHRGNIQQIFVIRQKVMRTTLHISLWIPEKRDFWCKTAFFFFLKIMMEVWPFEYYPTARKYGSPTEAWERLQPPAAGLRINTTNRWNRFIRNQSGNNYSINGRLMTKLISWSKKNNQLFWEVISEVYTTGRSEEYYEMFMPVILSRPYVLSPGCLADPGQPSTHALLGVPSAQNSMGRIQLCRHSFPESGSKNNNQATF